MAVDISRSDLIQLGALVDRYSLSGLTESLAQVASDKGEEIRTKWQDRRTAAMWDRASKRLDTAASNIMV